MRQVIMRPEKNVKNWVLSTHIIEYQVIMVDGLSSNSLDSGNYTFRIGRK